MDGFSSKAWGYANFVSFSWFAIDLADDRAT